MPISPNLCPLLHSASPGSLYIFKPHLDPHLMPYIKRQCALGWCISSLEDGVEQSLELCKVTFLRIRETDTSITLFISRKWSAGPSSSSTPRRWVKNYSLTCLVCKHRPSIPAWFVFHGRTLSKESDMIKQQRFHFSLPIKAPKCPLSQDEKLESSK